MPNMSLLTKSHGLVSPLAVDCAEREFQNITKILETLADISNKKVTKNIAFRLCFGSSVTKDSKYIYWTLVNNKWRHSKSRLAFKTMSFDHENPSTRPRSK
jgi:hypothetical protein